MKHRRIGKAVIGRSVTSKLRAGAKDLERSLAGDRDVLVVMRVSKAGYVPKNVVVRQRLGPTVYTALLPAGTMGETLLDRNVVAIEPSKTLSLEAAG